MQNPKSKSVDILWTLVETQDSFYQELQRHMPLTWKKEIEAIEEKYLQIIKTFSNALLLHLMDKHQIRCFEKRYNNWGKPYTDEAFSFNISHSKNMVVVAAGLVDTLGIDVESYRDIPAIELDGCFLQPELEAIRIDQNPNNRLIRYWCAKEAALKADGRGLSLSMEEVAVSAAMDRAVVEETTQYSLRELSLHPEYACYLALPNKDISVRVQEFKRAAK